ncbi:kinesin-like protein KIF21A isoform X2 [Danaus plexippus]|uniref:kinesin-like protein KIF21A isoform X2 n=1 Tax=Danaus plexippus TaxID=13037 RepID=UPI002AB0457E|nr:kinesin-like protein KIF21A isoform X2 [Danaus plexippus]XP_061385962.1 kinesin-like protein KIF21A isoform X2 [Danaus plexippus]
MSSDESSVRVAVRIRPQTPAEVVEGCGICARAGGAAGEGGVALGSERAFTFDYAFDPASDQQQLYDTCVRKLVENALDGYNATVLAYGQTGSGKTYTMGSGWEGEDVYEEKRGIIPRAIRDLFAGADERAEAARSQGQLPPEFSVQAQFIELYNEDIVDLLDPARDPFAKGTLRITEDGVGGVRIVGASMRTVRGVKEALAALRAGALARTTAATNMNSSSSRSHAVFTLLLRQRRLAPDQDAVDRENDGDTPEQYETLTAKFHFVDLAGSERLKRTGATGDRAKEGISINCGLLALGNVISALGDKSRKVLHVPYRDSKLTRLLQDSLGGNSNTIMIACISPSDRDFMETLNTLKYANRARNIKNRCVVNQDLTSRTISQLRQEVARLQLELAEYKQGKRVVSENGEEGWSDVVQENAILNAEVESLRRRVKAMQGTIEQLSARNSELVAEKALGTWSPKNGSPETADCSLTALVQGYVSEIEDLRAQLMEANSLYEASRRREARTRHDSSLMDASTILDDAKRELYKEKELLARSMGELEFQRKLSESGSQPIEERERAEGESAGDSEPSGESDSEDEEATGQRQLTAQLAALSEDIDTKARLVEQLEASQRRLAALRTHYEQRLDQLHAQIKATGDERDKVLASLASQSSQPSDKLKRVKDEYERRMSTMSRELKRLQAAQREHSRLQRSQQHTATQIHTLRNELQNLKRDKVKLVQRMRAESKRHAQAEAARAKEVAQLRKESRKNANLIRSLEAETRLKEQVLKRKQEEVSLLRRGHRDKLSVRAAGRLHDRGRSRRPRELWCRLECWVSRACAARGTLAELEAALEHQLRERDRAAAAPPHPDNTHLLAYLREAIAETQSQIMQIEEESEESELPAVLSAAEGEASRYALERLAALTLTHAHDAARRLHALNDARAQLADLEEKYERAMSALRATEDQNLNPWGAPPALAALLAAVSSGTSTRSVSPVDSALLEVRPRAVGTRESSTAPTSPPDDNRSSPFQRNTVRRGSVRLRDLGVYGREGVGEDPMSQSMVEPEVLRPAPLSRVPSAPGSLRGLQPVSSPLSPRRAPESPRPARRPPGLAKPASFEPEGTPPASPGATRRARDDDVFLRLTGAAPDHAPQGTVKEITVKRASVGGGSWLQCTHVAEGHVGAALSLAVAQDAIYSGGVDRTVRGWDLCAGVESWRAWCGGAVVGLSCVSGGSDPRLVLAAAGAAVKIFDTRTNQPTAVLWSSGASGANASVRGGEAAVTALSLASAHTLYTAAGDKLRLWDLRMCECVYKTWSGHAAAVMCVAREPLPAGDRLATGSRDHCVRVIDLQHNAGSWEACNRRLLEPPHYDGVQALLLRGSFLYSASRDSSLKCWSLTDNTLTHSVMNAHKGWVTGVCSLGGGLVSCGRDQALRLWSSALRPAASPATLPDAPHALAAHTNTHGHSVYTAGSGGEVRAWRLVNEP